MQLFFLLVVLEVLQRLVTALREPELRNTTRFNAP